MPRKPANTQIEPERHDQREERQLPPDHRTEYVWVETGHAREACDRRAQRAVGDGRGVGDQGEAGRGERRKAESNQNRAGDGHRRAKSGRALEKRAEGKCDQQQLQTAIRGDAADRRLKRLECALLHRQPVQKEDVENDPADREEACDGTEDRRANGEAGRHRECEHCDRNRDQQRSNGSDRGLDLVRCDQGQQGDNRQRSGNGRKHGIAERVVDLVPHVQTPPCRRPLGCVRRGKQSRRFCAVDGGRPFACASGTATKDLKPALKSRQRNHKSARARGGDSYLTMSRGWAGTAERAPAGRS